LGSAGGGLPARGEVADGRALYFFFSEKTPSAPEVAKVITAFLASGKGHVELRPALLVEDWKDFLKVDDTSPLYRTIRELGQHVPLQVFDEEALRLALAWNITRLPALVLVSKGRAHVLTGAVTGIDDLLGCSR
jgi:hypothetical protein